ncbi:hypothetical protein SCA6_008064 [Theobroma cacao]
MASEKDRTPTSSELFSSAKVVAGAAKSTFSNESDKVDKGKVAGAAADLLGAAKGYGKLDQEKGIGQYVDKAENYLHQYESSGATPATKKSDTPTNPEPAKSEPHASGGDGKDSGSAGVGDYVKVAQGFFKHNQPSSHPLGIKRRYHRQSSSITIIATPVPEAILSMESAPHNKPTSHHEKHPPKSSSELLSSAKLVAEAAKNSLHHESDKVDKGKVAGAAADLFGAASHYGKLDQAKGVGKYVDKAENYLHQYHSSHSTPNTTHSGHSTKPEKQSEPHASGGHGHGHQDSASGGYGDYLKMAQGFLKKH